MFNCQNLDIFWQLELRNRLTKHNCYVSLWSLWPIKEEVMLCFAYRYIYLKTYAKFTFYIKSPGHISDENLLYCCMHLASRISSYGVWNICDKKTHFYLFFKFSIFLDMYLKTYMNIFSHIFKMVTPRALRQLLLFIALNYLTNAVFIANLCSHLIPVHYKTSTICTSKRTFENSMLYIKDNKNLQVAGYFIDVMKV